MIHNSALVLNLEGGSPLSGYIARRGQGDNSSGADLSPIVQELKRQIVGVEVSSDCGENVCPINNFIDVVVNREPSIGARVCSQIISDASEKIRTGVNYLLNQRDYLEVHSTRVGRVVSDQILAHEKCHIFAVFLWKLDAQLDSEE